MKLYNFYRLVRTDETGRVITGDELKEILTAEGYTVPKRLTYPVWEIPPEPGTPGDVEAGVYSWEDHQRISNENRLVFLEKEAAYFRQFDDYAEQLDADFELARYVKDGNVREYRTDVEIKYTFLRAAKYLIPYKGSIEFITNNRFQG